MAGGIFVLLLLVVHVSDAVRILRKASKASFGEHVAQKRVSDERTKIEDAVSTVGTRTGVRVQITSSYMVIFFVSVACSLSCVLLVGCWWWNAKPQTSALRSCGSRTALTGEADSTTDQSDVEWCHPEAISLSGAWTSDIEIIAPDWTVESLSDVLRAHGLNLACGWTQKQLGHFAKELSQGKARLAREDNSLLRVVDMLIVLVVYERDQLVLQELAHPAFKNVSAEEAYIKECTLKSRLQSHEGFMECAQRCLEKFSIGRFIKVVPDILGMREERRVLHSAHPGLPTLMQYYVVEARVVATDACDLEALGLLSKTLHVADYIYRWDHLDSVSDVKRHLKHRWGGSWQGAVKWMGLSHSFLPVMPWTEQRVLEKLNDRNFPARAVPPPDQMQELLRALNDGCVSLAIRRQSPLRLAVLEEKVSVVVTSPSKAMIMSLGVSEDGAPILPNVQRHASESCWRAAVRLAQTILGLSAPLFQIEGLVLSVSDKVEDQKVWDRVTREIILRGPLMDSCWAHD